MNRIVLSKRNFFMDYKSMMEKNKIYEFLGMGVPVSELFMGQIQDVMDIFNETTTKQRYILFYPERFIPRNMSSNFWTKVNNLIKKGVKFNVETSDPIALGWAEWDTVFIERYFKDTGEWIKQKPEHKGYGHDIVYLMNLHF